MVLLGPTGAGKTVLVECIAGIHRPGTGQICTDDQDVTRLYPEERNVGYVPQDYALFPNMNVRRNLAYGLNARGRPPAEVADKVEAMMSLLGIAHLDHRLPQHLSGGEKQRVALGRALVTEPRLLLLDEPLCALDENFRAELAAELRRVQRALGGAFFHVCHSFEEASDVADRVAIMRDGRIVQAGTIEEVLTLPASLFVAKFTRTRNFFDGIAERIGDGCKILLNGRVLLKSSSGRTNGPVTAAIRPEDVELRTRGGSAEGCLTGTVTGIRPKPSYNEIQLDAGLPLIAYDRKGKNGSNLRVGDHVTVFLRPQAVKVFPQATAEE